MRAAGVGEFREGRAGSEEDGAVGVFDGGFEGAFGEGDGVGEWEDYGAGVESGHCLEDGWGKGALETQVRDMFFDFVSLPITHVP